MGAGCIRTDDDTTSTSADKDRMGASVGDTGVLGTLEVTVNADNSVLKYSTGDGWTVQFDRYLLTIGNFSAASVDSNPDLEDN